MFRNRKGFTLIELLVVIGILAVLLAITLIAVNPAQNLKDADDTKRRSDINAILNAVSQYMVDNNGVVTGLSIPATATDIKDTGGVNLCSLVPTYIAALPRDPAILNGVDIPCTVGVAYTSGYQISATSNRVTVTAPSANTPPITVTR